MTPSAIVTSSTKLVSPGKTYPAAAAVGPAAAADVSAASELSGPDATLAALNVAAREMEAAGVSLNASQLLDFNQARLALHMKSESFLKWVLFCSKCILSFQSKNYHHFFIVSKTIRLK